MLGTLIGSLMASETASAVAAVRRATIAYALAGLMAVCGLGFLIAAGYIVAADHYGDVEAALGFAGGFFLIGLIVVVSHRVAAGIRARRVMARRSVEVKTVASAAAVALLPLIMRRGVGLRGLLLPLAGLAAFQIYRENSRPPRADDRLD